MKIQARFFALAALLGVGVDELLVLDAAEVLVRLRRRFAS